MLIRDTKDIACADFSELAGLKPKSDAANFMKNVTHYLLSKEGALTDFPEGLQALALTSNGNEAIKMLL